MNLPLFERAAAFEAAFSDAVKYGAGFVRGFDAASGFPRIFATWMGGQNYRNKSKLYGAYPPGYLERAFSMAPDARRVLHLFSGSLTAEQVADAWDAINGAHITRVGISFPAPPAQFRFDNALHPAAKAAKPEITGNAEDLVETLSRVVPWDPGSRQGGLKALPFDLILADPPYRLADQRRYWREAMMALPGVCAECGYGASIHGVRYRKADHVGALVMPSGFFLDVGEHELQLPGYVRFRPLNKKLVVEECAKVLAPLGLLLWMDESWPMFSKRDFFFGGVISWVRSTNHRVRHIYIFVKQP